MSEQEMLEWIESASYAELLAKWRFEPVGSPWFSGPVADAYHAAMGQARDSLTDDERVAVSKGIGWEKPT